MAPRGAVNTFLDREGACYRALLEAAADVVVDVRDADGALEMDAGRGAATWEGWATNAYARAHRADQRCGLRYDQIFVSRAVRVLHSYVPELMPEQHRGLGGLYASDHLPIVADLLLPLRPTAAARWGAALAGGRLPVGWRVAAPAVGAATAACLLLAWRVLRSCAK